MQSFCAHYSCTHLLVDGASSARCVYESSSTLPMLEQAGLASLLDVRIEWGSCNRAQKDCTHAPLLIFFSPHVVISTWSRQTRSPSRAAPPASSPDARGRDVDDRRRRRRALRNARGVRGRPLRFLAERATRPAVNRGAGRQAVVSGTYGPAPAPIPCKASSGISARSGWQVISLRLPSEQRPSVVGQTKAVARLALRPSGEGIMLVGEGWPTRNARHEHRGRVRGCPHANDIQSR